MTQTPIPYLFGGNKEGIPYDGKPRRKLTDDEAITLINGKSGLGDQGRDPTFLKLQQLWFASILWFGGVKGYSAGHFGIDIDVNLLPRATGFSANHLFRIIMGQAARLGSANPEMTVVPKSPDIDDQVAAQVAEAFLAHYDDEFNLRSMRRDLAFWMAVCGTAFMRTDWDMQGGEDYWTYQNPFGGGAIPESRLSDEDKKWLRKAKGAKLNNTGELDLEILSPFQVTIPRGFRDLRQMPWLIVEYERSLDWLWDRYPEKAKSVSVADQDLGVDHHWWRKLPNVVHQMGFPALTQGADNNETILVREMWVPPTKRFPKGVFIKATKFVVLENGGHPYAEAGLDLKLHRQMRFPVTAFRYAPFPGRFWGQGLLEHLIDAQEDYNTTRTQLMQQRDILSHPQWVQERNAQVGPKVNDYGYFLEYEGKKPDLIQPPALSQTHVVNLDYAKSDMQMIAAQSDVSQARVPEGVRSGVAIRYLQEQDQMVLGPTVEDMEDGWQEVNRKILTLTWKFADRPKMIRTYGEFQQADITIYKGSQLNGNVFVRLERGSMMPRSKAFVMQHMMDLVQNGILNPMNPEDRELIIGKMDVGGADKLFRERNADKRRATIENYMFWKPQPDERGQPRPFPDVMDYDDHQVHVATHRAFMKTDVFENWPPYRKMAFQAHIQKHEQMLAQFMEAAMMMQAGPQGPGGGSPPKEPGKASQPAEKQQTPGSTPGPNS